MIDSENVEKLTIYCSNVVLCVFYPSRNVILKFGKMMSAGFCLFMAHIDKIDNSLLAFAKIKYDGIVLKRKDELKLCGGVFGYKDHIGRNMTSTGGVFYPNIILSLNFKENLNLPHKNNFPNKKKSIYSTIVKSLFEEIKTRYKIVDTNLNREVLSFLPKRNVINVGNTDPIIFTNWYEFYNTICKYIPNDWFMD